MPVQIAAFIKDMLWPWRRLPEAWLTTVKAFDAVLARATWRRLVLLLLSLLVVWHLYTPIHELLHVFACWATGGTVASLALKPRYGAHLLRHLFPFIVPASDYAGQLTDFSVPNYWAYAAVDFTPYVLSLFGVSVLEASRRKRSTVLFALGVVLAAAPVMGIFGDYYEAASLLFTQIGEALNPSWPKGALVSDDFFALLDQLSAHGALGPSQIVLATAGLLTGAYLVLVTIMLQVRIRGWFFGEAENGPSPCRS